MERFQQQLRKDIEKTIGFKIVSTAEAKSLYNLLLEHDIEPVSLSTLRRLWGLIPERQTSSKTLNALANFLGHTSYMDYVKHKRRFDHWQLDANIQRLKHKGRLSREDFDFLVTLCRKTPSESQILMLFEHAVHFGKWDYVYDLFDPENLTVLSSKNEDVTEFTAKLAYLVNIFLNEIPKDFYDSIIDELLRNDYFRYFMVYSHIDIINLNHRYGETVKRITPNPNNIEETLFLNLLKGFLSYLNTGSAPVTRFDEEQLKQLPDVLAGRYFGYQILCASLQKNASQASLFWEKFLNNITPMTRLRQYLDELINHLLIIKDFDRLHHILNEFYEPIFDSDHWHGYLDIFIFNIIDIVISCRLGDFKRARIIFKNLDTVRITYGSYRDYYLLYYYIIGFHLEEGTNKKAYYKKKYRQLAELSGFRIFDEPYLFNFLKVQINTKD